MRVKQHAHQAQKNKDVVSQHRMAAPALFPHRITIGWAWEPTCSRSPWEVRTEPRALTSQGGHQSFTPSGKSYSTPCGGVRCEKAEQGLLGPSFC